MKDRVAKPGSFVRHRRRSQRALAIALLTLGSQAGCGREFYREWTNQDVSEAIFEKSRDPRWRLDQFSIDPPALARFADPYDQDRPPAPPDDFPTEALSPVPQWPDHRLQLPVEGTGYLKLLDEGPRYKSPDPVPPKKPLSLKGLLPAPGAGAGPSGPPPAGTSPFAPGGNRPAGSEAAPGAGPTNPLPGAASPDLPPMSQRNSGPVNGAMSPTSVVAQTANQPAKPATTRLASTTGSGASKDDGIKRVAMQDPARPMPTQTVPINPLTPPTATTTSPDPLQTPKLPNDPNPTDENLSAPTRPRRDLSDKTYRETEKKASGLAGLFVPDNVLFDEAIEAGLRANSNPYILSMEKAFQIALINSRVYQFQLENVYINALPVTLQRFSFQPQFIAGLSPSTAAGGNGSILGGVPAATSPANSFLYNTRATGNQLSTLNVGTLAGVGKLADNGTRILASFANSLVFNFVGRNPAQPTVKSFLPIQALVPFLRGGGRAVTLEALTQAERSLLYSIRSFVKFRQEFAVATLVNAPVQTFGSNVTTGSFTAGSGNGDPTIGYLNVVEDIQLVENNVKNVAVFERFAEVFKELIEGEASGLSLLQLDQIQQQIQGARSQLLQSRVQYRNDLDQYKIQLGMPPDTPLVIDRTRTVRFKQIFEDLDRWALEDDRELTDVTNIVSRLPQLQNIIVDGRSFQAIFSQGKDQELENLLLVAERIALENRLDLMNARAQLYDTWRQIRVSANALKGVLNVAVTNQIVTPPTTNNPFAFLDQAKQFSLVLNAELPLVRVAERNNFRTQLINYQRQRRTLQFTEDFTKYQLRQEIRQMELYYNQYKLAQRNLVFTVRQKDQAFEQIVAPPATSAGNTNAAATTINLINAQSGVITNENNLVSIWYNYQVYRLAVYRDLGILPFDEWEAFDELFPPDGSNKTANVRADDGGRIAPARPPGAPGPNQLDPPGLGSPIPVTPAAAYPGTR